MQELVNSNLEIENLIYEIRGQQVMLDSDLAKLYQCKNGTKSLNLAVKRHINRFPKRFMFQLTNEEYTSLRFQIETANRNKSRTLPYVFTEEGVSMLSSVLTTPVAEKISIRIMDAFVSMRKYISTNLIEQKYINNLVLEDNKRINALEETFTKFEEKKKTNEIYFDGQIYDAYSKVVDIFKSAKKKLIIIDGYADKTVLDLIKNLSIKIILIVREKGLLHKLDIEKYNLQYHNLKVFYDNTFHDRYFILDKEIIYHCGTSLNHIGEKTFSINLLEDEIVKKALLDKINF